MRSKILQILLLQKYLPKLFNNLRLTDQGLWNDFAHTVHCETAFPPAIDAIITKFQKLLVIQAIRPDRLYSAIISFVTNILGLILITIILFATANSVFPEFHRFQISEVPSINPPPIDLKSIYKSESNENEPIMILISPGADPSQVSMINLIFHLSKFGKDY